MQVLKYMLLIMLAISTYVKAEPSVTPWEYKGEGKGFIQVIFPDDWLKVPDETDEIRFHYIVDYTKIKPDFVTQLNAPFGEVARVKVDYASAFNESLQYFSERKMRVLYGTVNSRSVLEDRALEQPKELGMMAKSYVGVINKVIKDTSSNSGYESHSLNSYNYRSAVSDYGVPNTIMYTNNYLEDASVMKFVSIAESSMVGKEPTSWVYLDSYDIMGEIILFIKDYYLVVFMLITMIMLGQIGLKAVQSRSLIAR